jgi:hypothetical protein
MAEEESSNRVHKPSNDCGLRNICKTFIRKIRGLDQIDYMQYKCVHTGNKEESTTERQLLCLIWFNNFVASVKLNEVNDKVSAENLFRAFVRAIYSDKELNPTLHELADFVKREGLEEKIE